MGKRFDALQPDQTAFIAAQMVFFAATVPPAQGHINLSPKGMDSLRVLSSNRILWLNLTGSGNETAAHLALDGRITLMWCSFGARPLILRAYGTARACHRGDPDWPQLSAQLPDLPGARQIVDVQIDLVQSSCGYAVPLMTPEAPRAVLHDWAVDQGDDGLRDYWAKRNAITLNGAPTGIEANLT